MNILSILATSVVGSLHCAAMCGGFVALAGATGHHDCGESPPVMWKVVSAYHAGRLLAYAGFGAIAGAVGSGLNAGSSWMGVQSIVSLAMLFMVIAAAASTLMPRRKLATLRPRQMKVDWSSRLRQWVLAQRERVGPIPFSGMLGLMSAFLPCAWLWSFIILAASTGSIGDGGVTMAAFWLGSVPALTGASALVRTIRRYLGSMAPRIVALSLIALATINLYQRWPTTASSHLTNKCPYHD